jgi:hypothetical protein
MKKIFVAILAICIVFSSCSKEISKLGELQKRDINTPSSPKDESSGKSTIQIPIVYYNQQKNLLKPQGTIETTEGSVIKLPNITANVLPQGYQIEKAYYCQGENCFLLGEEGIKVNNTITSFEIFYLEEEKKDENKKSNVTLASNSTLSPIPNHVSKKGFSLGKVLLIAALLTVSVYCILIANFNEKYKHVYDELKRGMKLGIVFESEDRDMFNIDGIDNPRLHDQVLSIISNAVYHNQPMPNLASYLNALIWQRIMTWSVSSYRAFSYVLVSIYKSAKFWIMEYDKLTEKVKGMLAERNFSQPSATAKLIILMKQKDLIGYLSEDEVSRAFNHFYSYVQWLCEATELDIHLRSALITFLKAIKALNKISELSENITTKLRVWGINVNEMNIN